MSKLSELSDKLCKKTSLRNNSYSQLFTQKYPVLLETFSDAPLEQLKEDTLKSGDVQRHRTNVQANMTQWFMHHNHSSFQWVCDKALKLCAENNPHKVDMYVHDCWGAVYRKGDYTKDHDHWPALWSFVFYVDSCDSCAPLLLPTSNNKVFFPENGKMIVFPAWIIHNVLEQTCDHGRFMVAGNISLSK